MSAPVMDGTLISAGVGLASGFVGAWLKSWLERWLESYKTRLRKSEFLFQKQFEAASEFLSLRRGLMPRYRFQEMEWADACDDFATDFEKVEKALKAHMGTHGAALHRKALDRLSRAIEHVEAGKFEVEGNAVSPAGIDTADKVIKELEQVENEIYKSVWSQSG